MPSHSFGRYVGINLLMWTTFWTLLFPNEVSAQNLDLFGKWETMEKNEKIVLLLNNDNSGSFDGIAFLFVIDGNEIAATYDYGIFHYEYELKGNQLTLKEGNLEHPYFFTRASAPPVTPKTPPVFVDNALLGTWSNTQHVAIFNKDGKVEVDGKTYSFEARNGKLKFFTTNSLEENAYVIAQNTLSMALNGEFLQLKRNTPIGLSSMASTAHSIPPELSGKWCLVNQNPPPALSNECLILTVDGSFVSFSELPGKNGQTSLQVNDKGNWGVSNSQIHFISEERKEQFSFPLTKGTHHGLNYIQIQIGSQNYISADKRSTW